MGVNLYAELSAEGMVALDRHAPVTKLKLNLGSGNDWRLNGVVNVDCRNLIPPDMATFVRGDVADLGDMFADECADEIWAHDVLEHFPQREMETVLDEWVRLLAPGGTLHLRTPDLYALAYFITNGKESDEVKAYRVYGGQDYAENFHRAGVTIPMLRTLLTARGLRITKEENKGTDLLVDARKVTR